MPEKPRWEVFFADPVDEDGNVIAKASLEVTHCPNGDAVAVKVPHSELGLEDMRTIRVDARDFREGT